MNLTQYATANAVKLTKPESNLLVKLESNYGLAPIGSEPAKVDNQFGFGSAVVSPLVAALVAFVYASNRVGAFVPLSYNGKKVDVGTFDRTRYLVLKLDSAAYSALLD